MKSSELLTEEMTLSDDPIGASYLYLLGSEIRFLEAAVEHLIPTDELGPGARDAGAVVYIDRQLAGSWGVHGRQYRGGHGWRARRSRATNRASRHKKCIALRFARSTSTAEPSSTAFRAACR
jgi:Gluconate 2-dehydrogenase subunit 3